MEPDDRAPLRRAALALHALSVHDRGRVWSRLDAGKRDSLEPLLAELRDLGIPSGQPWVQTSQLTSQAGPSVAVPLSQLVRDARRLGARVALQALSAQSLDTVACILACQAWPWRDAVMQGWPAEGRHALEQRVQVKLQSPSVASPLVLAALLSAFLREARSLPAIQALESSGRRNWFKRLLQR